MTHLLKMLAVPFAFVTAFMLFGTPAAPATELVADSGVACADTGGMCYGAQNTSGYCCTGYVPASNGGCEPEGCDMIRLNQQVYEGAALVYGTSAVIYTLLPGGQGMAVFMGVLGIAHGAYSVYLGYAHSECFGG